MPGAIAGEGDEEGYVFTIQATPAQVQEYYQTELGKLGWQPLSQEEKGSSVTLLFTDNVSTTLTIGILSLLLCNLISLNPYAQHLIALALREGGWRAVNGDAKRLMRRRAEISLIEIIDILLHAHRISGR